MMSLMRYRQASIGVLSSLKQAAFASHRSYYAHDNAATIGTEQEKNASYEVLLSIHLLNCDVIYRFVIYNSGKLQ